MGKGIRGSNQEAAELLKELGIDTTPDELDQLVSGFRDNFDRDPAGLGKSPRKRVTRKKKATRRKSTSSPAPSQTWKRFAQALYAAIPEELFNELSRRYAPLAAEVTKLYEPYTFVGHVVDDDEVAPVFVRVGNQPQTDWDFGCGSCDLNPGYLCPHIAEFVDHIVEELAFKASDLSQRINEGQFNEGPFDRSKLLDNSELAILKLDQLLNLSASNADSDTDEALPAIESARAERIAWSFSQDHNGIRVVALLQKKRKRGDGFTKGKKVSLERLYEQDDLPLTPTDREVIQCIHSEGAYYYSPSYGLDPFLAAERLIGQPNVEFDGVPLSIRSFVPEVTIKQTTNDLFDFSIKLPFLDQINDAIVWTCNDSIAVLNPTRTEMFFWQGGEDAITLLNSLLALPKFNQETIPQIIEKVQPLTQTISISLPDTIGGPTVDSQTTPVMLLRSRSDGKLDFGIRVRTEAGKVAVPGKPPLISFAKDGDQPIQKRRDGEAELSRAKKLLDQFDLHADDQWFGTIDDFQVALSLIEFLQSETSGIEVLWDKTSEKPVSVLGNLSSNNVRVEIASKRNWFGITGECKFENQSVPLGDVLAELDTSGEAIGDYVRLGDGAWARIGDKLKSRLKRLRDATHSDRKTLKLDATAAPAIRDLVADDVELRATKAWEKCTKRLANAEKLVPKVPKNLDADLRDYQVDGYKWLRRLAEWGVGGILADDMGLGKTLQALAVLLDRAADGPALVIAPTSVGFNWARESERFAPDLDVHLYRETERSEFLKTVGPGSLVICSYGLALRDAKALAGVEWNTMVLDEAQAIKNSRSKTSKAIASIDADWTVALTGTPVENHLGELWSLFHVVSPGVFGGWDHFRNRYATPIEKQNDEEARDSLAERLQPFVLRRTKGEVLTELPPRTEMNLYVDLSEEERGEYEKVRLAAIGEIEQLESMPDIKDQRFKILALMTRLRQIACHAGMVNESWDASSAKLDQLCETLASLKEEGHRVLIFSQFVKHLTLIRGELDKRGFTFEYLDGSTPAAARQVAVDRFQEGNADAFLISLKAGGTGLNLTAADYVIHMDPWWNPAVEDQATDRAHRMGQDKPVMVYRIVARGTIEEEILALHESKRDLVAGVMKGTEAAAKLTNEDLIRMLKA